MGAQVLALVLVTWLLVVPQLHGSARSLRLLFHVGNSWILLALAAELASLGFYTLLTQAMLPRRSRPPLQRVMRIDLSAIALGHCLPDGGAAGTALSWRLLVAEGVPSSEAAFAKVAQGLGSAIVLQGLLLVSYVVGLTMSGFSRWEVLPAAGSVIILTVVVLMVFGVRRAGRVVERDPPHQIVDDRSGGRDLRVIGLPRRLEPQAGQPLDDRFQRYAMLQAQRQQDRYSVGESGQC
jgi:hypothetical protein